MSIDQFNILRSAMNSQPDLRNEFELAFASIAAKHHPSDRAERFVFGGTCEWLLAITAWKAGVKALPAGHAQNGFDLMQFKGAVQGLWSLKSSASYNSNSPINLRNNISSSDSAANAVYNHPTVFMGPYLPGITYIDFANNKGLSSRIVYDKDAAKIKSKDILDYANKIHSPVDWNYVSIFRSCKPKRNSLALCNLAIERVQHILEYFHKIAEMSN